MAVLRTSLVGLDEVLLDIDSKVEEQTFVINALRHKSEKKENLSNDLFKKYKMKYEELYFSSENNLTNWKNYKLYLEEILKRKKVDKHLKSPKY